MWQTIRAEWNRRPGWMNGLFLLCLGMTFVIVPVDLFSTPIEHDQEVWLGIVLHGLAAKLTEPLHWFIYAAGAWGFWKMRGWMWPWAAVYTAQVAVGTMIWNYLDPRGSTLSGMLLGMVFMIPTIALWRSRRTFGGQRGQRCLAPLPPHRIDIATQAYRRCGRRMR